MRDIVPLAAYRNADADDNISVSHSQIAHSPGMGSPYTLRPVKLVEQADGLIQYALALYEQHEPIMRRDDRMLAEDRMKR